MSGSSSECVMAVELVVLLRLVCVSFEFMTPLFIAFELLSQAFINEDIILVDGLGTPIELT